MATMSQTVSIDEENFPSYQFRNYLLSQSYGKDGILVPSEIKLIYKLNVKSLYISDLTGIEYFTELKELYCDDNNLIKLDISSNKKLEVLTCTNNRLTELNISQNVQLTKLNCSDNQIKCSGMDVLIGSLPPQTDAKLTVIGNTEITEGNFNICTHTHVVFAKQKGWKVYRLNGGDEVEYDGISGVRIDINNFVDINFRKFLLGQNYGQDEFITTEELLDITTLDVSDQDIEDLWGIKNFKNLNC